MKKPTLKSRILSALASLPGAPQPELKIHRSRSTILVICGTRDASAYGIYGPSEDVSPEVVATLAGKVAAGLRHDATAAREKAEYFERQKKASAAKAVNRREQVLALTGKATLPQTLVIQLGAVKLRLEVESFNPGSEPTVGLYCQADVSLADLVEAVQGAGAPALFEGEQEVR